MTELDAGTFKPAPSVGTAAGAALRSFSGQFRRWRQLANLNRFESYARRGTFGATFAASSDSNTMTDYPCRRSAHASSRRRTPEPAIRRAQLAQAVRSRLFNVPNLHGDDNASVRFLHGRVRHRSFRRRGTTGHAGQLRRMPPRRHPRLGRRAEEWPPKPTRVGHPPTKCRDHGGRGAGTRCAPKASGAPRTLGASSLPMHRGGTPEGGPARSSDTRSLGLVTPLPMSRRRAALAMHATLVPWFRSEHDSAARTRRRRTLDRDYQDRAATGNRRRSAAPGSSARTRSTACSPAPRAECGPARTPSGGIVLSLRRPTVLSTTRQV